MTKILKLLRVNRLTQPDELKQLIIEERKKEREVVVREKNEELDKLRFELTEIHNIEMAKKDAEIHLLEEKIDDLKQKVSNAQKAYNDYYNETTINYEVSNGMKVQVEKMFNNSGEIYQAFKSIHHTAERHFQRMTENDEKNRQLLGISSAKEFKKITAVNK